MRFKRQTFSIRTTDPKYPKVRKGLVSHCGIWGIDKRARGEYQLTHIPTGRGVGPWMKLAKARELAERLSAISDDWDRDYADIRKDRELGRQATQIILEIRGY